jgi:hypothetical protein
MPTPIGALYVATTRRCGRVGALSGSKSVSDAQDSLLLPGSSHSLNNEEVRQVSIVGIRILPDIDVQDVDNGEYHHLFGTGALNSSMKVPVYEGQAVGR